MHDTYLPLPQFYYNLNLTMSVTLHHTQLVQDELIKNINLLKHSQT